MLENKTNEKYTAPTLEGVDNTKMLSIDISTECDLRCRGCFTSYGAQSGKDMDKLGIQRKILTLDEIDTIIRAASQMEDNGQKIYQSVLTVGQGEPAIDKDRFWEFIKIVNKYDMTPVVVTHGMWATENDAKRLWDENVTVLSKLWSLDENVSRMLLKDEKERDYVDFRGARIPEGVANLVETYTHPEAIAKKGYKLALNTLINSYNAGELGDILRWDRENKILPFFEFMFSSGVAYFDKELWFDGEGGRTLREEPFTEVKRREAISKYIVTLDEELGFTYPLAKTQEQKAGQNVFNNSDTVFINPFGYRTSCEAIADVSRHENGEPIHAARNPEKLLQLRVLPPCLTGKYACGADQYDREKRHNIILPK